MEASGTGKYEARAQWRAHDRHAGWANIEIQQHVGAENMFIFGLLAEEVAARRREGIDTTATIEGSPALAEVLNAVASGVFSPDDKSRYRGLVDALTHHDYFMVTADFEAYREAQRAVGALWQDQNAWWRMAVLNTARMSWFSADRAILDYAQEIWRAKPSLP
jgi:starch phosphorylase